MNTAFTEQERVELAHMMMGLFDDWKVSPPDQVTLLGLGEKIKPRALSRYRQDTPLPEDQEVLLRVKHLVLISEALQTSFPHNAAMATYWISTPNRTFNHQTPLAVMLNRGLDGIRRIHGHLDCTQTWI